MKKNIIKIVIVLVLTTIYFINGDSQHRVKVIFESGFVGEFVSITYQDSTIFNDTIKTLTNVGVAKLVAFNLKNPCDSFTVRIDAHAYLIKCKEDSLNIGINKYYDLDSIFTRYYHTDVFLEY